MILTLRGWLVVLLVGLLAGATGMGGWRVTEHLLQDHADHHLVLELLKYNVQQGRLVPLPFGPPASPGGSTGRQSGPPPPSEPKK